MTYSCILDTNVLLALKCDGAKFKELGVETQIRKLKNFPAVEGELLVLLLHESEKYIF